MRGTSKADNAAAFLLQADSKDDVDRVIHDADELFANSAAPTKTETESAYELGFVSFLGNLKLFLLAIAGAVSFTILLVSANTIAMPVRERTREVGILKTLGFTREKHSRHRSRRGSAHRADGRCGRGFFCRRTMWVVRQNGPASSMHSRN